MGVKEAFIWDGNSLWVLPDKVNINSNTQAVNEAHIVSLFTLCHRPRSKLNVRVPPISCSQQNYNKVILKNNFAQKVNPVDVNVFFNP